MGKFVTVVDYGLGNLRSVSKALQATGVQVKVSSEAADISKAGAIVLPGVGAFRRAMDNLKNLKLLECISGAIKEGKPFLGICLGLQVLFTESEEHGRCKGLGIIKGKVRKFPSGAKIPHMGWNSVKLQRTKNPPSLKLRRAGKEQGTDLFNNIPDDSYFYFVHSYYVEPENKDTVAATTEYGQDFVSAVNKGNLWGVQFHPEKSERLGLKVLENFTSHVK